MDEIDLKRKIKDGTEIPWHIRCFLEESFHKERVKQHGTSQVGRPDSLVGKRGWAIKDSSTELSLSVGFLCEDLQLAKAIRSSPELKNYTRDVALKTIKKRKKNDKK